MGLLLAGLLLLLCCSAYSYPFRSLPGYGPFMLGPELEWEAMEKIIADERTQGFAPRAKFWRSGSSTKSSQPEARKVPEYLRIPASKDQKELFQPEKGARPLPDSVKEMLLMTAAPSTTTSTRPNMIDVLCHVDRMYVRIRREFLNTKAAYKFLKLGTCPVNQATTDHYYLLYLLTNDCGFKTENNPDQMAISNVLHYKPDPTSPVVREMPFDIPLQCNYHRFHHAYKVGFYPKIEGGTVFKALKSKTGATLTPQDASGKEIAGSKTYTMGQPMQFVAKLSDNTATQKSGNQKLYVNKCFMTASQDPNSSPKYTVIDNQGCMVDGMVTDQSKFITDASEMTQTFRIGAFIFKDMVSSAASPKQLYMHCEIVVGPSIPTATSKACNYDSATKKWKELYGYDSVCVCCDSSCSSAQPKGKLRH
ncbi:zona pellucida sperm-binding protein 3 [Centroberyx gerrardi]